MVKAGAKSIKHAVVKGEIEKVERLVRDALKKRGSKDILAELLEGMGVVGEKFERKEYFVPETLLSAHAMQKGIEILKPHLDIGRAEAKGKVIIGTVEGDIHDIGKNLVSMFLEGAGFEVHNLGRDVPTKVFLEKAKELKPDIVALSALLTTTIEKMQEVIKEISANGLNSKFKIIVGGAALSREAAKEIGADGYAEDAAKAVRLCEELMKKQREKKLAVALQGERRSLRKQSLLEANKRSVMSREKK